MESSRASYEKKNAEIRLKPGNSLTLPLIARQIKEAGFAAKSATVTVKGEITGSGTRLRLKVSPRETLDLSGAIRTLRPGQTATLEGSLQPKNNLTEKTPLVVTAVR